MLKAIALVILLVTGHHDASATDDHQPHAHAESHVPKVHRKAAAHE